MTKRNPEYDFKWCPGCGDFGVKRAIELAIEGRTVEQEIPVEKNVIVAGIGCSGNLVHLMEGPQPFGFHGIHGRTLPIAFGIKMGNPDLSVLVVAGDGDFLSIGGEHIGPAAQRNMDVTCVIRIGYSRAGSKCSGKATATSTASERVAGISANAVCSKGTVGAWRWRRSGLGRCAGSVPAVSRNCSPSPMCCRLTSRRRLLPPGRNLPGSRGAG